MMCCFFFLGYIYIYTFVCVCVCVFISVYMCGYIYIYIYICVCVCLCIQGAEAKYGIIFKTLFSLISPIFEKNAINLNFSD